MNYEYDIAMELAQLHILHGAEFIKQLKMLTGLNIFQPLSGETDIFITGGERGEDFENLLNAARKAVSHGNKVYILPNPKGIKTADFIFERKGVYKMFDLKTITGRKSVSNRLTESIGQTNRVLLNMAVDYNPGALARSIKRYFELNVEAREVLVFKGKKVLSVTRQSLETSSFYKTFILRYTK